MSKLKIMVAGSGNPHVPGYLRGASQSNSPVDLVAVSDFDAPRLNRDRDLLAAKPTVAFYTDYQEMLAAHPEVPPRELAILQRARGNHAQQRGDAKGALVGLTKAQQMFEQCLFMIQVITEDESLLDILVRGQLLPHGDAMGIIE